MPNSTARETSHGFGWLRRALVVSGAFVLAGVLFTSATSAVATAGDYVTSISSTDVVGGASLTVTITNCDSGTAGCAAASTNSIASADLTIAGGSFDPTDAAITAPASGWSLTDASGTLVLTADPGSELAPGASLSVQFSAPSAPDTYPTSTHAFQGADDATGGFGNDGTDPVFVVHGPLTHFALTNPTPTPETAGEAFTVDVAALDVNNNAAAGWMGATNCVKFSGPGSSPNPVTDPSYPAKGGCGDGESELSFGDDGQTTASIKLFKAESPMLKVEDTGGTASGTLGLTVDPGSLASLTLAAPGSPVTAGTGFSVDVTALDAWGNGADGWSGTTSCVKFSGPGTSPGPVATPPLYPAKGGCASADASELTFDGTGKATSVPITLYKAESPTLRVEDAATGTVHDDASLTVDRAGLDHFTLTNPTPATPTAGTPFAVDVAAQDAYGNAAIGWISTSNCVVFSGLNPSPSANDPVYPPHGSCSSGQSSLTFDGDGKALGVSITAFKAESPTLQVADTGGTPKNGTILLTVNPAPLHNFTLGNLSTTPETAGVAFTLDVAALDAYGNGADGWAGQTDCAQFSGPGNSPSPSNTPPSYPANGSCSSGQSSLTFDASGKAASVSITLFDAESPTLKVENTTGALKNGTIGLTVNPGPLHHFTLNNLSPGSPETAGVGFAVDVAALDQWSNAASGWISTTKCVVFSGPGPSPNPSNTPPTYPGHGSCATGQSSLTFNGSGKAPAVPITLFNAESPTLTVQDTGGTPKTGSIALVVNPAPLDHFTLNNLSPAAPETAGTPFMVDVLALDHWSNAAAGWISATKCVVFSGPGPSPNSTPPTYPARASCPSNQSSLGFDTNGKTTAGITLFNANTSTVSDLTTLVAKDSPSSSHSGQLGFRVVPGSPKTLTFTSQPTETQVTTGPSDKHFINDPSGVSVKAVDNWGNVGWNTSVRIQFGVNAGSATPIDESQNADSSGVATFTDFTVDQIGVGYTLSATAPGFGATATAGPTASLPFIVAQSVTPCGSTCNGNASTPKTTITVNGSSGGGANALAVGGNTLGIAIGGSTVPGCPGFTPAAQTPGVFVNTSTSGALLTVTWFIPKSIVNLSPNNGAAHYNMCFGTGVKPFTVKAGTPALVDAGTNNPLGKAHFWWGIIPDCPSKNITNPCVKSRTKDRQGDLLFVYVIPTAWAKDPGGWVS